MNGLGGVGGTGGSSNGVQQAEQSAVAQVAMMFYSMMQGQMQQAMEKTKEAGDPNSLQNNPSGN